MVRGPAPSLHVGRSLTQQPKPTARPADLVVGIGDALAHRVTKASAASRDDLARRSAATPGPEGFSSSGDRRYRHTDGMPTWCYWTITSSGLGLLFPPVARASCRKRSVKPNVAGMRRGSQDDASAETLRLALRRARDGHRRARGQSLGSRPTAIATWHSSRA